MLITEKVIGFKDERGRDHPYEAVQQRDPNMKARSRNFRTSSVVLHIDHEWFSSLSVRRIVADRLRDVLVREYSVSPQDISSAATNIRVQTIDTGTIRSKCVVVFDEIYGCNGSARTVAQPTGCSRIPSPSERPIMQDTYPHARTISAVETANPIARRRSTNI